MSSPTNVRFPDKLDRCLAAYARRSGTKKSTVVVGAVSEWLRMQAHPGILFVTDIAGVRHAALAVGPQVWTVAEAWLQHDKSERNAAVVADALGLSVSDVETALGYWADNRDEIDDLIERRHADQDAAVEAWERRRALDAAG